MSPSLREQGQELLSQHQFEPALALLAEAVRRTPTDHRSRLLAARCMVELGERERAVTVLHTTAENLLGRDYLLSAIAACKQALRLNPVEKRLKETLRRIHARASAHAPGKASGAPPPSEVLFDAADAKEDLSALRGEELSNRAFEVLASADPGERADINARPPLPLFSDLDADAFVELVERMGYREVLAGDPIVREGDGGETIFIIVAGKAEVVRTIGGEERTLAILTGGALVGELAVILGAPRTASVVCVADCDIFEISRDDLNFVGKRYPSVPTTLALFAQKRLAKNLLATAPLFVGLPEEHRSKVLSRFLPRILNPNEKILLEGERASGLFLVLAGELVVEKQDAQGSKMTLNTLHEGDVAGEISLLTGMPATATVSATRKTHAAFLPREEVQKLMVEFPAARQYLEALSQRRLMGISAALLPAEVLDADELIVK
jgi:CRP-like cAMP-binding protein